MELTLSQALQKGIEAHKAGKFEEADRIYTAILQVQPNHADANHNLGVLAVKFGKVQQALSLFRNALEVNPSINQYWRSYIDALVKLDRFNEAKEVINKAKTNGINDISLTNAIFAKNIPQERLNFLFDLYGKGKIQETIHYASILLENFPDSLHCCIILLAWQIKV